MAVAVCMVNGELLKPFGVVKEKLRGEDTVLRSSRLKSSLPKSSKIPL